LKKYRTAQRESLVRLFCSNPDRQFTIEELQDNLDGISLSSIYRNINDMVKQGTIRRFQRDCLRSFCYQYIGESACNDHLHLKCSQCGCIIHMDSTSSSQILAKLRNSTGFELDKSTTILHGSCSDCKY